MINKQLEKKIRDIFMKIFKTVSKNASAKSISKISDILTVLDNSKKYDDFAKKVSVELSKIGLKHERGMWRKYFERAKKMRYTALPKTFVQYEKNMLTKAVKENFKTVKSIPKYVKELMTFDYFSTLVKEVVEGKLARGAFKQQLLSHGHKRANVIARTETAKLQTFVLENRATDLGSVAYIWLASRDKRTRPSHREMEGVVVFWRKQDEKPLLDDMRGNAGEFPNCRCSPQPILDEDDLIKSNYVVYDYISDKKINMSKKKLLDALVKGEL